MDAVITVMLSLGERAFLAAVSTSDDLFTLLTTRIRNKSDSLSMKVSSDFAFLDMLGSLDFSKVKLYNYRSE